MKMTLNQLLVEMDGFDQNKGIIVIGTTNFPDVLDNALIRPGRFDRHVTVFLHDVADRKKILEYYGSKVPLGKDVDLDGLARATPVNEAALRASIKSVDVVDMDAFEFAKDKILMEAETQVYFDYPRVGQSYCLSRRWPCASGYQHPRCTSRLQGDHYPTCTGIGNGFTAA
ncbi:hypothetical protein PsorP6_001935 [Peronosclerospora sorghi]|uniref:Uncharacterized protein n=1 Tax=Peronosclerospora sorghi TaxID=230839 RepID=A0ACC0WT91_9STRA|nr:hypothetical protein PsorP6_001935 [Peronosclerospora sorghi]